MAPRLPRLAILTLPTLEHFIPDLARGIAASGRREVRCFPFRGPATLQEALAWADEAGDAMWFEFCWPPFPALIAATDFGTRQVILRIHRVEVYETEHVARADLGRVTDLIVVSEDMARCVREAQPRLGQAALAQSIARPRLHVVHNGVDLARVVPRADFDRHRIGWCGALIPRKNPSLALQVLQVLRAEDSAYRLHIASQVVDRLTIEALLHQALRLDLAGALSFDGHIAAADMPAWHARNGVLLSTSLHESFGMAIAEAAAAGCDIAVLDHLGAEEFWPDETRFVALADAVRLIRDAGPDRWTGMIAERFSLRRQVEQVLTILDAPPVPAAAAPFSSTYWQRRYAAGGTSGAGSKGRLAAFKAETLNCFVARTGVGSVLEFGCGDGRQLALARYPAYVGVDVAPEAVALCRARFRDAPDRQFLLLGEADPGCADLVLSLDVVFHLVEDAVFHAHMTALFARARRFVAIYASDRDATTRDAHVRHRDVSGWVAEHAPEWRLLERVANPYPFDPNDPDETSFCDMMFFARRQADATTTAALPAIAA